MKDLLFLLNGRGKSIPAAARFSFDQGHYSVNGEMKTFSDLFTTTRASLAWDVVDGALVEYATNEPMISSKGLGSWEAATNVIVRSHELDAVNWLGTGDFSFSSATSIGDSIGVAADKITNGGTNPSRALSQNIGVMSASEETSYAIIENVDASTSLVGLFDVTAGGFVAAVSFDWATKAASLTFEVHGTGSTVDAELLAASGPNGGEVYLISLTTLPTNSGNSRRFAIYPTGTTQNTDSAIIHHTQHCELGYITPPILTDATAVTRSADVIVNNAAIGPWYNQSEGAILVEANSHSALGVGSSNFIADFSDGSTSNIIRSYYDRGAATARPISVVTASGAFQGSILTTGDSFLSGMKYAQAYKLNDRQLVIDGTNIGTDLTATMPTGINQLNIGIDVSGTLSLNGYIQQLKYYNTRLPQAELEAITS